jgi:hypothetical protein
VIFNDISAIKKVEESDIQRETVKSGDDSQRKLEQEEEHKDEVHELAENLKSINI